MAASLEFEPQDAHLLAQARAEILEGAEYRFDFGLSQSVRYVGLVAYVTCVEWGARVFMARLAQPLPKKPVGKNESVHTLEHLNKNVAGRLAREIETYRQVVFIRNYVVHSAGLVKGDKHEVEIREALNSIAGFGVSTEGFLGESIHIEEGAVERLARATLAWLPSLDEECTINGTFRAAKST